VTLEDPFGARRTALALTEEDTEEELPDDDDDD
jgi:hypothetical protein